MTTACSFHLLSPSPPALSSWLQPLPSSQPLSWLFLLLWISLFWGHSCRPYLQRNDTIYSDPTRARKSRFVVCMCGGGEAVPTSVRILFISSFFLWALEARFCFSIHLLSSRLRAGTILMLKLHRFWSPAFEFRLELNQTLGFCHQLTIRLSPFPLRLSKRIPSMSQSYTWKK